MRSNVGNFWTAHLKYFMTQTKMHRVFFNSDHCNNNYFQRLYTPLLHAHIDTISSGPRFLHYWQVLDAGNSWFIAKDGEFSTSHTQPKEIPMDILKCQLNCIEKRRETQIPTNIHTYIPLSICFCVYVYANATIYGKAIYFRFPPKVFYVNGKHKNNKRIEILSTAAGAHSNSCL